MFTNMESAFKWNLAGLQVLGILASIFSNGPYTIFSKCTILNKNKQIIHESSLKTI
jgi:hypothetical protein